MKDNLSGQSGIRVVLRRGRVKRVVVIESTAYKACPLKLGETALLDNEEWTVIEKKPVVVLSQGVLKPGPEKGAKP